MTIFIPPEEIAKRKGVVPPSDKSRYLASVLRSSVCDEIRVIDGKGRAYAARIATITKKGVTVDIREELSVDAESPFHLILCQGMLKGEKMDLVIQKATELGIKEIVPLITERSIVKETRKLSRWRKIAEEASEQCGRAVIPTIHEPVEYGAWLNSMRKEKSKGIIFWEQGGKDLHEIGRQLSRSTSPLYMIIGPEGGLTAEEVAQAEQSGIIRATLGKRILRAETAAMISIALVQFALEAECT